MGFVRAQIEETMAMARRREHAFDMTHEHHIAAADRLQPRGTLGDGQVQRRLEEPAHAAELFRCGGAWQRVVHGYLESAVTRVLYG